MPNLVSATATALNQNWTRYKTVINDRLRQDLVSLKFFNTVRTLYAYSAPNVNVAAGSWFQPYQSAFTSSGNISFLGEKYVLIPNKVDKLWDDEQLLSFQTKWDPTLSAPFGESRLNFKFFTDYLIGNIMLPVLMEEMETIMLYKAKYEAPTQGVASVAMKAVDGLEIVMNRAIQASKLIPLTVGNFNDGVYYDRVLAYCDMMPQPVKDVTRRVLCDPDIARKTHRDIQNRNKYVQDLREVGNTVEFTIPGTNKIMTGTPMMSGKQRLVLDASPMQDNLVIGMYGQNGNAQVKPGDLIPNFRFQEIDRNLKILGESQMFIGIENFSNLYVSDGDPATV